MSNLRKRFKVSTLSLAILSSISAQTLAVEEEQKKDAKESEDSIEIIEVEGFRGSLIKSMNNKRHSGNVTDSIFAEDIGKSTDQNIADALSRITGVSVQSEDGEGTTITVRGANANQNVITLNGMQLTSSDFNQSVDLSAFSSDVLSSINVIKTPSADHDEGSLGASIELKTSKPLDLTKDVKTLTLQGRYNDFSENQDYKLSGSFSKKFLDETFGVLVTVFDETNSVRRDQFSVGDFQIADVTVATDQNGNVVRDTKVITPTSVEYSLYENERNRHGGTVTFQFLPTDSTDISLDVSYSKQELTDTNHNVTVRTRRDLSNFEEGVLNTMAPYTASTPFYPTFSDPQAEWWTIDSNTKTLIKGVNRFADGGFGRRNGGSDTTNTVANLNIEQSITDDLIVELGLGYSKTHLEPHGTVRMNLLNGKGVSNIVKARADAYGTPHTGIQPAGFDCTTGVCNMVFGTGLVSLNDPDVTSDNQSSTAFNPDDLLSQVNNSLRLLEREVEDESKTAFIDVDWSVDFGGITKIEFGAKYTERDKYVDNQSTGFESTIEPVEIIRYDPEGRPIGTIGIGGGSSLKGITADNFISDEPFPYDNFMADLGFERNNITDGWALVSEEKLLALAYGAEDLRTVTDDAKTRSAGLENTAAYLKLNFEYFGGKLTGDMGVRYVKRDILTTGYSGTNFIGTRAIWDPFVWRQLADRTNPDCQITNAAAPNPGRYENRIDGIAWDRNGTPKDFSDDTRIEVDPSGYPCYDPATKQGGKGPWASQRHADTSTLSQYKFGDDPSVVEDRHLRSFEITGENSYDDFLPSLNLNYQFSQDFIGRFAASKTLSHPNIDSLQPGFTLREGFWGDPSTTRGATIQLRNPKLLPLESKNLDISLEWYFNEASLLSAAFFVKDMSNFEEQEEQIVYADDLRSKDLTGYSLDDLIKTEEQIRAEFAADPTGLGHGVCMPKRGNTNSIKKDWWHSDDLLEFCSTFTAIQKRNGKGATIKGIELGYQQNYDFLPGIWAGLGTTINYTYQTSETDLEFSSIILTKELPQFSQTNTPEHTYNATVFWEQNGHQIRLAYRGNSDQLVNRDWNDGALWQEGSGTFDFSASYKVTKDITASLQVINLTDESTRIYYTSRSQDIGLTQLNDEGEVVSLLYDEGNVLDGSGATKSRTQREYKNGRTFRLGLRVNF